MQAGSFKSFRVGRLLALVSVMVIVAGLSASPALANHSWGNYHWAVQAQPFTLSLGDSTSWDSDLAGVWGPAGSEGIDAGDWSRPAALTSWPDATPFAPTVASPLRTKVVPSGTTGRKCRPSTYRIEVCNAAYGKNGWLGLASIWASGDHLSQATVKLNDSYMSSGTYSTRDWRRSVACQEIGHTFGLSHQDESGADLDTCMDYSNTPNIHPDQHDYNVLGSKYGHPDSSSGPVVSAGSGRGLRRIREGLYVEDLGGSNKRFVFVVWKDQGAHHGDPIEQ